VFIPSPIIHHLGLSRRQFVVFVLLSKVIMVYSNTFKCRRNKEITRE
jgi:hypothetical protein